jgi:splicing factor 3A subunit 1
MHDYFIGLVESYTRCLNPPKNIVEGLSAVFGDKQAILDRIVLRHEWELQQEKNKKSKEEQEEEDRVANQMIDWHDFVIVETITFDDEMPQPTVPLPMPASVPTAATQEDTSTEMETEDVEMDVEEPVKKPSSEMRIRKDYVKPALGAKAGPKFQRCPRCGQDIPTDQMDEHVRIELLDPKYRLQRQNIADRGKGLMMASDDEITRNLTSFARRRTDIFESEADLGRPSTAEEDRPSEDKLIWDGHTGSIPQKVAPKTEEPKREAVIPTPATSRAPISSSMPGGPIISSSMPGGPPPMPPQPRVNMPPAPPMNIPGPPMNFRPPPSMPPMGVVNIPLPMEGEPSAKKQKLAEEVQLIPEDEFLKRHSVRSVQCDALSFKGLFTAQVQCPQEDDKPEWKLQGQTISVTVNYTDTVKTLKEKIKEQVGIPPNKQKLKGNGQHLKDQPTMAFYNFTSNTPIVLSIRERGGKK